VFYKEVVAMIDDFIKLRTMVEKLSQAKQNYDNQMKMDEEDSKKLDL
jgi:hypothetical protein